MRKKCEKVRWILSLCCFLSGLCVAHANYAEADDLVNELDRPSEYQLLLSLLRRKLYVS
jgi:hypothetical protein